MYDIKRMKDFVENMYQQEHAWLLGEKKSDGIAWEKNGNADLCKYLLSEPKSSYWKTWNNIARWTKGILVGGEYPKRVTKKIRRIGSEKLRL